MTGLTVIIPAYNEEGNLADIVENARKTVRKEVDDYEIIIVNDGSTDTTEKISKELSSKYDEVKVISHDRNQGSGMAIRTGIKDAGLDLIIYIPADGQFELAEVRKYIDAFKDADIVIGSRIERSDYSWFRLLSSWVFIKLVNLMFRSDYKDVNWVHMWKKKVFDKIEMRSKGVFLLEEILVRAVDAGFKVREIDSAYKSRISGRAKGSHPVTIIKSLIEMISLWLELSFRGLKK